MHDPVLIRGWLAHEEPLVLDSPHSGNRFPDDFAAAVTGGGLQSFVDVADLLLVASRQCQNKARSSPPMAAPSGARLTTTVPSQSQPA